MSQVQISAGLVKELRDLTGAGMMAAKRALEETGGDVEAAQRLLREQGMAAAGKKAGRETSEGEVLATVSGNVGALVAIGCETEPVSKNEEFLGFAEAVLEAVEADGPDAVAGLEERRLELIGRLGENVEVRGASRMEACDGELLAEYVHPPANKIGVLVRVRGTDPAGARRLAMHISFAAPRFLSVDDVPAGGGRLGARDLRAAAGCPVQAGGGPREDRRGPPAQGVPVGDRAERAGLDPRAEEDRRPGARGGGAEGARVRALRPGRVTVQEESPAKAGGRHRCFTGSS